MWRSEDLLPSRSLLRWVKVQLQVPLDRLLTETDSPFMTPEPLRGIECGPEFTIFTAAKLCELYGCTTLDEQRGFLEQLFSNACSLLDRELTPWQVG